MKSRIALLGCAFAVACSDVFPSRATTAAEVVSAADSATLAATDTAAGQSADSTAATDTISADSTVLAVDAATAQKTGVSGYWMYQTIGNCILGEEWLQFADKGAFTHTLVDRNVCASHSVSAATGTYAGVPSAGAIGYAWKSSQGDKFNRNFTYVIVDGKLPSDQVDPKLGYKYGTRGLNRMGYINAAGNIWQREDISSILYANGQKDDTYFTAKLQFAEPLPAVLLAQTQCSVTITLAAYANSKTGDVQPETQTFTLPCKIAADPETGWLRVTGKGFEVGQFDDSWNKFMTEKGWWKSLSPGAANLYYERFRPIFYYLPGDPVHLFHDVWHAWFQEMLTPPPTQIP